MGSENNNQWGSGINALVVEDEAIQRAIIGEILVHNGVRSAVCESGEAALQLLKSEQPDIILLDLNLPGIDGFEVCRQVRASYDPAVLPIIFITSEDSKTSLQTAFALGANDYICKPVDPIELAARMKSHCQLKQAQQEIVLNNFQLEQQVDTRTKALEQTNRNLNQTLFDLEQANKRLVEVERLTTMGRLVAGLAHEINTPLGIAITANSLMTDDVEIVASHLEEGNLTKRELVSFVDEALSVNKLVEDNLKRVDKLVGDFKHLSTEFNYYKRSEFNLYLAVNEQLDLASVGLTKQAISCHIECSRSLTLDSYEEIFAVIFSHLIDNVVTHAFDVDKTDTDKQLSINISAADCMLLIEVKDNGKGMNGDAMRHLFDPFYTTSRAEKGSTGLGMYLVFNLVHSKLNGEIECQSQPNQGTSIYLRFAKNEALDFKS